MNRPKISEIDLHRSVADFLNWMLLPPAIWTTFPAGWTAMRKGAAGRLKGCGLLAGMPDILVFYKGFTIGIELKTEKGKISDVQRETALKLARAGIIVHVCRSIDDVHDVLALDYKVPLRKFVYGPIPDKASKASRPPQPDAGPPQAAP